MEERAIREEGYRGGGMGKTAEQRRIRRLVNGRRNKGEEIAKVLWLTLSEKHLQARGVDWSHAERFCFNEWSNPDDDELGDQIVKDLHRTGCSLFCGEEAEDNQAMLKRVLLAYARWNKAVGYCQGFNMLAAIILEVMERQESDALKVMIYLIEGVLPESYFANNLRGLSVDMAVFRDLLRLRLPHLSRHLEHLQHDAADLATGTSYEPPLTNVFTMQWFLTLFSNCLPRETVMRVWDLTFLQGDEVLLRGTVSFRHLGRSCSVSSLASHFSLTNASLVLGRRILDVHSADEFYTVMGVLTQEMLTYGLMDANKLVQTVVGMAPFPFPGLAELRDKYTYNITPWTHSASPGAFVPLGFPSTRHTHEISRPNLDISALKKQYARLRERQKQAHIILTGEQGSGFSLAASQLRVGSSLGGGGTQRSTPLAMNHLLRGKKALTSKTKRGAPQGVIPVMEPKKKVERKFSDSTGARPAPQAQKAQLKSSSRSLRSHYQTLKRPPSSCSQSPPKVETLHWKDTPRRDRRASLPSGVKLLEAPAPAPSALGVQDEADDAEGGSSTSTELCDDEDEDKLSDLEADAAAEGRPATTSPRLETVTEVQKTSPAKQPRRRQEAKAITSQREKPAAERETEPKPGTKPPVKAPQEKPEVATAQTKPGLLPDSESRDKPEIKSDIELEAGKLDDSKADIKPPLREEEETKTSIELGETKLKTGVVESSEEEIAKQAKLEDRIKKIIPENKLREIESQKEPETLISEGKTEEIKAESEAQEIKPEIKPNEIKPAIKAAEIKPPTDSIEIKPEIKEITEHAAIESLEIKPEIKPKEIKPEIKPEEIKPEIKPKEIKPGIKAVEIKPEIKPKEIKPEIKPKEIKPEIKPKEIN
ncbi:TBC1 domain family member 30 [Penaeus vannamei]|uniref:TBC1 domain family member 30 n=1 Tax=Penaeus vannamei TaxID=6689 RepID=A0A3R7MCH0_PENVA|nr:TBC1 domain family member 30 [Penaeus vannamei]